MRFLRRLQILPPRTLGGLLVCCSLLLASGGCQVHPQEQSSRKIKILVTGFDGPGSSSKVTQKVLSSLYREFDQDSHVQIVDLGRALAPAESEATARTEGERHQAAIVLWGRSEVAEEKSISSVHFEMIQQLYELSILQSRTSRSGLTFTVTTPESFF